MKSLLASVEIESVTVIPLSQGKEIPSERAGRSLYAIRSGVWMLTFPDSTPKNGVSPSSRSSVPSHHGHVLYPGDAVFITRDVSHALEFAGGNHPEAGNTGDAEDIAYLRMTFRPSPDSQADSPMSLPPLILTHCQFWTHPSVLPAVGDWHFSPANPTAQDPVMQSLAMLVMGMVLGSRPDLELEDRKPQLDPEIAQTLVAMEREPGKPWTIERLADEAGISRSALAQKFKEQVGSTLSEYLLNIRMRIANDMLRDRRHHLKEIARKTGYQSVSAFSTAFKRWSGQPPSAFRKST